MAPSISRSALHPRGLLSCVVALAMVSLPVLADTPSRTTKPDPLEPQAAVPAVPYASSLKLDLRPRADGPISWREANDTVTRIGGWRVYAREASQPAAEQKTAPAPAAAPAPTTPAVAPVPAATPHAHGGHHKP